jgi:aryl-alcohol dehydrogenase-like predicted oxidoreductase
VHPDFTNQISRTIWRWSSACERSPTATTVLSDKVAIAWTLGNPAVTGAIVGARNVPQAEEVMRAGDLHLTEDEVNEIEAVAETAA